MLRGIDTLAHAVRVTLGPKGRNVVLDKSYGAPRITKDGVTVAKEIELEDKFENMGAQMVREVASRTSDEAGDGTTTATVLAHAIVREGAKAVAAGMNPMDLKRGVDLAVAAVVADIQKNSKDVTSNEEIAQVGTISSNGDVEIGRFIADAMKKVGNEGVITVEEAKSLETELEVVEGMQFDRGYISPYFVTNAEKMRVDMEDPYILIYEKKLSGLQELLPLLESVVQDVEAAGYHRRGRGGRGARHPRRQQAARRPQSCCRQGAGLRRSPQGDAGGHRDPDRRPARSREDLGIKLENVTLNMLGRAKKVMIEKENTTIVNGAGKKADIEARITQIKAQIEETTSDYDREKLQERLAKLAGGVAVIRVGGATEIEVKERKDRVDDAMHATRAAVEEGILPGGGVALLRASEALKTHPHAERRPEDRRRDRPQGDHLAGAPDCHQCRRGRRGRDRQDSGEGALRLRLRRPDRRVWQSCLQGHHRPDQGGARRAAGCSIRCGPAHHYRGDGCRTTEEEGPGDARWGRRGRYGWHGLLIVFAQVN